MKIKDCKIKNSGQKSFVSILNLNSTFGDNLQMQIATFSYFIFYRLSRFTRSLSMWQNAAMPLPSSFTHQISLSNAPAL